MSTLIRDGGRSLWPNFQRGACVLALSALSACASRMDGAPVVDRSSAAPGFASMAPADQPPGPPPPGFYRVKPGDTLYRVALENGQNYRDITNWNNLTNPNQIEVGQLLRVAPPGANPPMNSPFVSSTPVGGAPVQTAPLGAQPGPASPSGYVSPYASAPGPAPTTGAPYPSPYAPPPPGSLAADGAAAGLTPAAPAPAYAPPPSAPSSSTPPVASGPVTFIWPVRGQIVRQFNGSTSKGIDIAGTAGTPIVAAAAGRVLYAGNSLRGYGNLIIIKHDNTFLTAYGHNRSLLVKENDVVTKGQAIAEMGDTQADRVMLHFEVRQDTKPVDPMKFLPSQ
ncbi:peptidoglycan DD-metalloendopeptidase family protein [Robbsia sp. Bb-Pol-6]|uniref:Peptidoglycan DD-metalloendopeptidase family protein n=1 Tax=Robbsia betulipollinis TaxID=2981849 RepID=A0ABT3ZNH2_9BURK|nr:peptidoglycan DD-metalloendopeptidase family protein [Robbsia betulipollinis]MCY0388093.1 peptidoglycan DD-metalloendopeptidase family protein [Robbsia betulipollinis]